MFLFVLFVVTLLTEKFSEPWARFAFVVFLAQPFQLKQTQRLMRNFDGQQMN